MTCSLLVSLPLVTHTPSVLHAGISALNSLGSFLLLEVDLPRLD